MMPGVDEDRADARRVQAVAQERVLAALRVQRAHEHDGLVCHLPSLLPFQGDGTARVPASGTSPTAIPAPPTRSAQVRRELVARGLLMWDHDMRVAAGRVARDAAASSAGSEFKSGNAHGGQLGAESTAARRGRIGPCMHRRPLSSPTPRSADTGCVRLPQQQQRARCDDRRAARRQDFSGRLAGRPSRARPASAARSGAAAARR